MNTNLTGVRYTRNLSTLEIPPRPWGCGGIEVAIAHSNGSGLITAADPVAEQRLEQFAALLSLPLVDDAEMIRSYQAEFVRHMTFPERYEMTVEEALQN